MEKLLESETFSEELDPRLYLNKCHREISGSNELEIRDKLSDDLESYLRDQGIKEDTNESVCSEFAEFIRKSDNSCFRLDGFDNDAGACAKYINGMNRHKPEYKKRVWAKIQCLNDWYKENPTPISMVTLTVYQRELEMWEQFDLLKEGYQRVRKMLHKYIGAVPYLWVIEPHESGSPHMHLLVFSDIPTGLQEKLTDLWMNKYNPGASIQGHRCDQSINFEITQAQKSLDSAAGYVFAYVGKTLNPELLKDRESGYFLFSAWVWKMSQRNNDYTGVRTWDCSQDLKQIMKTAKPSNVNWWRFSINVPANEDRPGGWMPLWVDEDIAVYPDRVKEFDDSLAGMDQESLKDCKDLVFLDPQVTTNSFSPSNESLRICPYSGGQAFHSFCEAETLKCMDSDGLKCGEKELFISYNKQSYICRNRISLYSFLQ